MAAGCLIVCVDDGRDSHPHDGRTPLPRQVTWLALALFFVVFPAILAFQYGRAWTLAMPVALIAVCAQWVFLADDGDGLPATCLGLAVVGLFVTLYALSVGRRRRRRPL